MSKQKQKTDPRSQKPVAGSPATKTKTAAPSGINSMMSWLAVLLLLISFLYSETPLDTAVSIRYIFLSGFTLLFVIYFLAWKKRIVATPSFLIKLVFIAGAAFALWNLLGLFGAINYHEGYYEISRHLLHLVLLFIVIQAVMQEPEKLKIIFYVLTVVALLHSLVGAMQFYELAFTKLPGNYKPYGFMTNRNLFGSAQALLLPFCIYTFYVANRSWKIISVLSITGIFVSLLLSQTRSSWLSGIAILLGAAILVLIFVPALRKKWMLGTLGAVIIIALIVTVLILPDKESGLARSVTERASSLSMNASANTESGANISERLRMWKKTVKMIGDHPLLGVGAGNWKVVIPSYGLDSTGFASGFFAPDRVHNTYLQIASETGVVGAIFYFGMWLLIVWTGFSFLRNTKNEHKKIMTTLMLAGIAAVAVDAMFSFAVERIEHSVYMVLMAGIIMGLYAQETGPFKMRSLKPAMLIAVVLIAAFNIFLGKKKFDFEKHLKMAIYYNDQKRFPETIAHVNKGRNEFFTIDITGNPLEMQSGIAYKEQKNFDASMKDFKKAIEYSPHNGRIYNNRGTVYWDLKQYQSAIDEYKKALVYTPEFGIVRKNLAISYYQAGQYNECIQTIEKLKIENDRILTDVLNDCRRKLAEVK